jgi:hypothetical protein
MQLTIYICDVCNTEHKDIKSSVSLTMKHRLQPNGEIYFRDICECCHTKINDYLKSLKVENNIKLLKGVK